MFALKLRYLILLSISLLYTSSLLHAQKITKTDIHSNIARWQEAYLYHVIFLQEYKAVMAIRQKASHETEHDELQQLHLKVKWAGFHTSRLQQNIFIPPELKRFVPSHKSQQKISNDKGNDFHELLNGFPKKLQGRWKIVAERVLKTEKHSCHKLISKQDYDDYFSVLQQELVKGRSQRHNILKPIMAWHNDKKQCLLILLQENKKKLPAISSLALLEIFRSWQGEAFQTLPLLVAEYVEQERFASALHLLLPLMKRDDSYRLAYELVQRIFSIQQKGSGQVALERR